MATLSECGQPIKELKNMKVIEHEIEFDAVFEGSAVDVATSLLEQFIDPVRSKMATVDTTQEREFLITIACGAIAMILEGESADSIDHTSKSICNLIDGMAIDFKNQDGVVDND